MFLAASGKTMLKRMIPQAKSCFLLFFCFLSVCLCQNCSTKKVCFTFIFVRFYVVIKVNENVYYCWFVFKKKDVEFSFVFGNALERLKTLCCKDEDQQWRCLCLVSPKKEAWKMKSHLSNIWGYILTLPVHHVGSLEVTSCISKSFLTFMSCGVPFFSLFLS